MRLLASLVILGAAFAALLITPVESRLFGLDHQAFAGAAALAALLVFLLARTRASDLARVVGSALVWAALLVALTGVYAYRFEAADFFGRITSELMPSEPEVGTRRRGDRQSPIERRVFRRGES